MSLSRHHGGWAIVISIIAAILLTTLPIPSWAAVWRPAWVALVLIYWCMAVPDRVGVGIAWLLGLVLDIHAGTLFGQHALGMCITAYAALHLHQRIRVLPLWQQGLSIFALVFVYNAFVLWTNGILGRHVAFHAYWTIPLMSMVLWPWVFVILRDVRRRYEVY